MEYFHIFLWGIYIVRPGNQHKQAPDVGHCISVIFYVLVLFWWHFPELNLKYLAIIAHCELENHQISISVLTNTVGRLTNTYCNKSKSSILMTQIKYIKSTMSVSWVIGFLHTHKYLTHLYFSVCENVVIFIERWPFTTEFPWVIILFTDVVPCIGTVLNKTLI